GQRVLARPRGPGAKEPHRCFGGEGPTRPAGGPALLCCAPGRVPRRARKPLADTPPRRSARPVPKELASPEFQLARHERKGEGVCARALQRARRSCITRAKMAAVPRGVRGAPEGKPPGRPPPARAERERGSTRRA